MLFELNKTIALPGVYSLRFTVTDCWTISCAVLAENDPTLHDTERLTLDTVTIHRGGELNEEETEFIEGSEETLEEFAARAINECKAFAIATVDDHVEAQKLAACVFKSLADHDQA